MAVAFANGAGVPQMGKNDPISGKCGLLFHEELSR
jgi:hypothetical protein